VHIPGHTEFALADTMITGRGFTTSDTVAVFVQLPEVPTTVYVVLAAGVTTTFAPVRLPGCQV
jgi:hypothetical protein